MSDYAEYEYDYSWYDYGEKERVINHVDILVWLVFPIAALGFISSVVTLVFVALFPKPLKTTIIHCIVFCVSSILTCMISTAQAASWEIKDDLYSRGEDQDFIIVDYAISWITILLLGVANWLFVAFVAIRLYAISKVNINSYVDYVAASANEVDGATEGNKRCRVCGVVCIILFFGWLLPTFVLPVIAMIEFFYNWLGHIEPEKRGVTDVFGFAFQHEFNHRWGSTIYVLLPIGITVLISGVIVYQTGTKIRGLKFMRTKWDKAKLTLGAILLFFLSRLPMLVYVFFAFQAYPPAPKKTGDAEVDLRNAEAHQMWTLIGNRSIRDERLGAVAPLCLIFACVAAAANFPLFYATLRRFRSLCAEAKANCSKCGHCCDELVAQRSTDNSEVGSTDAEAKDDDGGSYIVKNNNEIPHLPHPAQGQSSPANPHAGNFFFNSEHLNGQNFRLAQSNAIRAGGSPV